MAIHLMGSDLLDLEAYIICCRVIIAHLRNGSISEYVMSQFKFIERSYILQLSQLMN
jgi:hypothetical protein